MLLSNGTIHSILAKLGKGVLPEIKSETRKKFLDKFYFISKGSRKKKPDILWSGWSKGVSPLGPDIPHICHFFYTGKIFG